MDLSGIIFVVLAVAWAVYLIPKALRHHDEAARTRSIDRFSHTMRVLARREPVGPTAGRGTGPRDSRLVVPSTARSAAHPRSLTATDPDTAPGTTPVRRLVATPARRAAARAAARRRRRILSFLSVASVVVTALAWLAVVPWWSVAIPVGLTLVYLLLCRTQVKRERARVWEAEIEAGHDETAEPSRRRPAARVEATSGAPLGPAVARNAQGFAEVAADDDTHEMPAVVDAVMVPTDDGGSLWDPLPVTLPTYVDKPRATRTVRTINLDDPDTWSSARSEEDSRLVADNASSSAAAAEPEVEQRAVGT